MTGGEIGQPCLRRQGGPTTQPGIEQIGPTTDAGLQQQGRQRKVVGQVRFVATEADDEPALLTALSAEIERLKEDGNIETTLLIHPHALVDFHSYNQFLDEVWGLERFPSIRTVDQHVAKLRKKIELDPKRPRYLVTVHGLGYRLEG